MKKNKEQKSFTPQKLKERLRLYFIVIVFTVLLLTFLIEGIMAIIFINTGLADKIASNSVLWIILIFIGSGLIISMSLFYVFSKSVLKPLSQIIEGIKGLALGNYSTRVEVKEGRVFSELSKNINLLAQELESTELLHSNFVNNFSHEIKTPVLSISGFAKLLKKDNISEKQKSEYIDIILEESTRLSTMSTNILNLSRLEQQSILKTNQYNLSEQLRLSILLLEDKWKNKDVSFFMVINEYDIIADEEMLKQVWINLIDNAIKFATPKTDIEITLSKTDNSYIVNIKNYGKEIDSSDLTRIFNKFYQVDKSHSNEGNGIGLSIVKRIVELHGGSIFASSENGQTVFSVTLPINCVQNI